MTRNETIKKLLKINLDKIINKEFQANLSIVFKDDKFVILNSKNNTVLIDKILDYDLDFESQKNFVLKVLSKIFKYVKDEENFDCVFIESDCEERKCRIVGNRDCMYAKYYVEIVREDLKICKKIKIYEDCLDEMFEKIAANLDENKVEVFYYDNCLDFEGFYINVIIYDKDITVNYVDGDYSKFDNLEPVLKENKITVYYSDIDKKEAIESARFIEKLLYDKSNSSFEE